MRVWFLKEHESVCPGCSTGCNIVVDERDGEVQRLRPRRNADVNKSWMCDPGRALYKQIAVDRPRLRRPRPRRGLVGGRERRGGARPGGRGPEGGRRRLRLPRLAAGRRTRTCSPSRRWPTPWAGRLDFRVGDPQHKVARADRQRAPARGPQPEHAGLPRPGRSAGTASPRSSTPAAPGQVKALVLQGPELLRVPEAVDALAKVPFVAVMATHEGPELDRAHASCCPRRCGPRSRARSRTTSGACSGCKARGAGSRRRAAAVGARRRRSCSGSASRSGRPRAREVFALVAKATPDYAGLDYRAIGAAGPGAALGRGGRAPRRRPARRRGGAPWLPASSPSTANQKAGRLPDPQGLRRHPQELLRQPLPAAGLDHPVPRAEAQRLAAATAASTSSPSARTARPSAWPATCARPSARPSASTSRRASGRRRRSRSTRRASRSTSSAASTAASASTPARRRRSS